ncbi:MAG: hypothetical protein KAV82_14290 [Phycisphaerae bacterium]|nr:hypothetical protein [Phycisphaerae bacterium]
MIGDTLVITDYHRQAAAQLLPIVLERLALSAETVVVTIAGESGSGKSETALCLAAVLAVEGRQCLVLAQDDYFRLPPKSNHRQRVEDISWVGPCEVRLDLLAEHITALCERPDQRLAKPLARFDEDRIDCEIIEPGDRDVVIAEGTYTTLLPGIDIRVFIDRDYHQTKKARLARARDPDLAFLEQVLEIEHREISQHKVLADVIIAPPPDERAEEEN